MDEENEIKGDAGEEKMVNKRERSAYSRYVPSEFSSIYHPCISINEIQIEEEALMKMKVQGRESVDTWSGHIKMSGSKYQRLEIAGEVQGLYVNYVMLLV